MLIVLVPSSAYLIKNILNLEQRWSTRKKLQNYLTTSKLLQRDLTHLDDASNPHVTRAYYERLFPFKQMYQFYNVPTRLFTNREFAFTVKDDIYLRYLSFSTWDEWKKETLRLNPTRFEIGAVYTARPRDKKSLGPSAFKTKERELVFDIDMTDYDEIRTCAAGKDICEQCWGFVVAAMRILDTVLRQDFGYKHLLWVFSGRRGIHCWVSDPAARALTDEQRKALVGYIEVVRGSAQQAKKVHISQNLPRGAPWHPSLMRGYEQLYECFEKTVLEDQDAFRDDPAWRTLLSLLPDQDVAKSLSNEWVNKPGLNSREKFKQIRKRMPKSPQWDTALREIVLQYVYPRIDTEVSKHQNHLLKAPFCIHPGTGKVCVPVDVSKAEEFNPSKVPTIGQLLRELEQLPATAGRDVSQVAEVGWQFVTQYYNYVNAKPENLHYFYNKDSTFIHGFEDGDERTCFGQSEINSRVSEIGFENCKVFVHSLDSQSSADGGILVQVVGEMSNRNGPWRKFAQTFFLAQQQSGYFVLNDIFRYLRDDDEVDEEKQHTPVADVESDLKETTEDEATNGIAAPKVASPVPAAIASPTPPADVQTGEAEKVSSPVPATATTSAVQSPKPAVASPEKSNQPKTWANLAASNSKKWGQVAQDKVSPSIQSAATATSPRTNKADASKPLSQAQQNVQSVSHALCFVKNVTDQVQGNELRSILQAKFGLIRDVDVVRTKACAFVQFDKIESAKKAIIASHSKDQGGEGGIKIGNQTVMLESRREKPKNNKQNQQKKSRQSNQQSQSNRNKK
ncbi:NTF2-like protein [Wallemia mellicola]|uniref:DNA primase n=1 Tax=Wallemia mellicola TaxID=1708541 RepID=A0A4T0NQ00_9BASI|nr:NTF2-like protein [Wallemia mellicola]